MDYAGESEKQATTVASRRRLRFGWTSNTALLWAYTANIFVSATLLFMIQPMFARMVLPMLGGSPAVWNTAVVFYQTALLAGYIYAHVTTARLGVRRQALLHAALLFVPLLVLPIAIPAGWTPPTTSSPIPWMLALLVVAVGLPFFVIAASSPLLQAWFARTGHPQAHDPYFLYAASNAGSMLGLLLYPLVLEPQLRVAEQSWLWSIGYGVLLMLTLGSITLLRRCPSSRMPAPQAIAVDASTRDTGLTIGRRARWVLLAFVPSSMMLGVTSFISIDISPFPLLWAIPLALYLLTFILAFARKPLIAPTAVQRVLPGLLIVLTVIIAQQVIEPIWLTIPFHLLVFGAVALVCHGAIARDRPGAGHLTEFYLWMSVGGMLGGMFNALLAPLLFSTVIEYPLVIILATLLLWQPGTARRARQYWLDLALGIGLALWMIGLQQAIRLLTSATLPLSMLLSVGAGALVCLLFWRRPIRLGFGLAALFLVAGLYSTWLWPTLLVERSFFGVSRVLTQADNGHALYQGRILHGVQFQKPELRNKPVLYYHFNGPVGQVFDMFDQRTTSRNVAVVGLGTGNLGCYKQPNEAWTFYEIDPSVVRIARDPQYFTYLRDCAPDAKVVLGDARLSLTQAPAQQYDMMVLDAYSSDSIPVHLMTREALALYLDKLAPNGVLLFHISNRYLDLEPVLAGLANDAGIVSRIRDDAEVSAADKELGKSPSRWVVMTRDSAALGALANDQRWQPLRTRADVGVWTDDFSSILPVLR